ncbi:MurR/RpiR family transcriptional regulator [Streptococcus moroccensis]|uniref:DNA-binding MurR/RpiR family transcriptional regulator n=1 Tax=Streptococcus moroccensis TaxID=1451356 RepID=A0ABT9YTA2_9STRE|nr:MurR/RpiR family transcriptional regulator [Streptococcus moroccensis]MDQ0223212.1 DNA-binding MurR/RpiR family transcriptional regulator [Streptococcus moroccensis]
MTYNVISLLLNILNKSNSNKVEYAIAEGLLKNFKSISDASIHEMAELCFVSPSSLSRFVKKHGFTGYGQFKQKCREEIDIEVDYSNNVRRAEHDDLLPVFQNYTNNIVQNLNYNLDMLQKVDLAQICGLIHDAPDVAFLGLEFANIIGQHFQVKLAECNRFVHLKHFDTTDLELVDSLKDKSVVIIGSLEGGYLYRNQDVLRRLKEKQITIIAITMENHAKIYRDIDYLIFCNKFNSETEGRISLLHTIELLIMTYFVNYKY